MHNLATVEGIGASIGRHHSVEVSALLICHLFNRLRLGSSVIGDENKEMAVRSVHRQAFGLFAKGVFGLAGFENFSRGADELVVSSEFMFPGQGKRREEQACHGSSRKFQETVYSHQDTSGFGSPKRILSTH